MVLKSPRWHFSPKFGGAIELVIVDPSLAGRLHGQERSFESSFDDLDIDKQFKNPGLLDNLHGWWDSRVSMILPQGADIRDHFGMLSSLSSNRFLSTERWPVRVQADGQSNSSFGAYVPRSYANSSRTCRMFCTHLPILYPLNGQRRSHGTRRSTLPTDWPAPQLRSVDLGHDHHRHWCIQVLEDAGGAGERRTDHRERLGTSHRGHRHIHCG